MKIVFEDLSSILEFSQFQSRHKRIINRKEVIIPRAKLSKNCRMKCFSPFSRKIFPEKLMSESKEERLSRKEKKEKERSEFRLTF